MPSDPSISMPLSGHLSARWLTATPFSVWFLGLSLIGYWGVLIHQLGAQWSAYEQYHYGWAVPVLCLYLLWQRVSQYYTRRGKFGQSDGGRRTGSGGGRASCCAVLLLYGATRVVHEANPIWRLTSLLLAMEVIALTLLCLATLKPQRSQEIGDCLGERPKHFSMFASVRPFAFSICFFLVAVPWPSALEGLLTQSLMRMDASITVEMLGIAGVPAVQHGNVLEVGSGIVGIDEACSGIRSTQATMMLALFFGELYGLTWRRRVGLLGLGFGFAFVFNLARTLLLTGIAALKGIAAMAKWHDPAGVIILVGCFVVLWLLAIRLRGDANPASDITVDGEPCRPQVGDTADQRSALRRANWVAALLFAWLVVVEAGTELWYGGHERVNAASIDWSLGATHDDTQFTRVDIPKEISSQFNYDQGTELRWRDSSGNAWQLYYLRWFRARSLKNRVAIQLAKSHGPELCLPAAGMKLEESLGCVRLKAKGFQLALQQFRFSFEGRPLYVFYGIYEDPSGSKLANRRLDSVSRIEAALAGSRNCGQRFVEFAVSGPGTSSQALTALESQLPMLMEVQGSSQ